MMRIGVAAVVVSASAWALPAAPALAQSARAGASFAQVVPDQWGPPGSVPRPPRRPPTRLRVYRAYEGVPEVYPRYFPGPGAVRACNATYELEHRPSGTVVVPRLACVWRPG